jgi:hypothetical protein
MARHKFYISADRLHANGACKPQIELFERTFGENTKVAMTDKNFERAIKARLQIWWLAFMYLDDAWQYDGDDFGDDYEPQARRYWKAIKAQMKSDNRKRPPEWY